MIRAGFIERHALAGIGAASEALFPMNDYGAPDFRDTEMVPRTLSYLDELPPEQRRLLVLLFAFVELVCIFFSPRFCRFSRLPVSEREELVRALRRSSFLAARTIGDALKAATTIIYMSHPRALAHVGAYSPCERTEDPSTRAPEGALAGEELA